MSAYHHRTLLAVTVLLLTVAVAEAAAPAPKPTTEQIARWIEELGDDSFAVREKASKKLWSAGAAAESALEKALASSDVEVARRARDLLNKFRWGIYPDTPADIVALIGAYQSSQGKARQEVVQKLLQNGSAGLQAVFKISRAEKDEEQRKLLAELVSSKLPSALPRFLENNHYEQFEALLEQGHENDLINHNQYTAYWLLRGKLDERIAHFRARLAKTPADKRLAETLAYLHRAKGDRAEARKAAEKSERADLIEGILCEAGDWKALAARPNLSIGENEVEKKAFRAAFARLAGDRKAFEKVIGELREQNREGADRAIRAFTAAKALLLNDRPAEGLELLAGIPRQTVRFEILCAQLKYPEAMKIVGQDNSDNSPEEAHLEILQARTLYWLGEKEKARALFARLAKQITERADVGWVERLLEAEYRVGLKDLAFEHCAKAMSEGLPKGAKMMRAGNYLSKLFPTRTKTAEEWWLLLRMRFKDETNPAILKRLRALMEGKVAAKEVKAWIEGADVPKRSQELAGRRLALAEAAVSAGLDDLAFSLLEKAATSAALTRRGDLLAGKKQWAKAAECYRQAWRKNLTPNDPLLGANAFDPLPLYLAGDALVKSGQEKDGKKLIEQSHWVLLADAPGRYAFLQALAERGCTEAARRETDLLLRVSDPNTRYSGAAMYQLAVAAAARKDYVQAADCYQQAMFRCLNTYINFVHAGAYVVVPSHAHYLRACALLAAGKFEEANEHIDLARTLSPGSIELPIVLVPELERRGRKKEATALFDRSLAVHEKLCQSYPRCAWAHNSAAWLSACCRRNLDRALKHARAAVELEPNNAGYLDTLAEIHFQRGDKDKAVALQKRAVELNPKRLYFRKQLKRLQAGDPSAERPPENGD